MLDANGTSPADFDGQVSEILGKVSQDLAIWRTLSSHYKVDLFCGFMMKETNEGLDISSGTLEALGARGIMLGLSLYAPLGG